MNGKTEQKMLSGEFFPCVETECAELSKTVLEIAQALHVAPEAMLEKRIREEIAPLRHCVPSHGMLTPPFFTAPCRYGFVRPAADSLVCSEEERKIIGKKYISDADASESGACAECLKYAGRVFKWPEEADRMPKLPLHPNCKCRYEDVYEIQDNAAEKREIYFRAKGSPGKYGYFGGGIVFDGIDNFIELIEKSDIPLHSIDKLIIVNHSGIDDFYNMGNNDDLRHISNKQVQRLKKYLHPNTVIDIRMCSAASGQGGKQTAQKLADRLGCKIIAYEGPVSPRGGRPSYTKDFERGTFSLRILPDHKPIFFLPRLDKK